MKYREDIKQACEVLHAGGLILYPTDTIWGIGCDATNEKAVEKIYTLKKRSDSKSMLVLIDNDFRLKQYIAAVPEIAWELLNVASDPLTLIYPGAKNLATNLVAEDNSIGIRMVNDKFCQDLIQQFRKPIVSTSANVSGDNSPAIFSEITESILDGVDYVVNHRQEDVSKAKPSGIIKLGINGEVTIIRK